MVYEKSGDRPGGGGSGGAKPYSPAITPIKFVNDLIKFTGAMSGGVKKPKRPTAPMRPTPSSSGNPGQVSGPSSGNGSTSGRPSSIGGPGRKGGPGRRGGRAGGGGFGGGGIGLGKKSNNALRRHAEKVVNRDIRYANQQLRDEIGDIKRDTRFGIDQANTLYNRGVGDLKHIFGEANEQNVLNTQAIMDRLAVGQNNSRSLYDGLVNQQQATTGENREAALAELSRLGIADGANFSGMESDANFANLMAQQTGANNQANLASMSQSAGNVGNLISQMAASSQASHSGRLVNERNDQIGEMRNQFRGQRDDVKDAMRLERLSRANRVQELYDKLEAQAYDRWFNNREANRSHALGQSNFNLSVSKFNADQMWQQAALLADERAAAAEARNNRRELSRDPRFSASSFLWDSP